MLLEAENLCLKCPDNVRGKCCMIEGRLSNIPILETCNFLTEKGWCSVYDQRFEKQPRCLTVEQMLIQGRAPRGCLYVKKLIDWFYEKTEREIWRGDSVKPK